MITTTSSSSPAHPTDQQLALLGSVIRTVARTRRLSAADAEDFGQAVQLRLLERNYDIFHRFAGRSSLRTYLTVVVTRLLLDWRDSQYGKWRPSAAAVRLGPTACRLEQLLHRDGCTLDEAIATLGVEPDPPSPAALRTVAARLPLRLRRRFVCSDVLESMAAESRDPFDEEEERRTRSRVRVALAAAMRTLSPEDQQLIRLRYAESLSVQALARRFGLNAKALYRRFEVSTRAELMALWLTN